MLTTTTTEQGQATHAEQDHAAWFGDRLEDKVIHPGVIVPPDADRDGLTIVSSRGHIIYRDGPPSSGVGPCPATRVGDRTGPAQGNGPIAGKISSSQAVAVVDRASSIHPDVEKNSSIKVIGINRGTSRETIGQARHKGPTRAPVFIRTLGVQRDLSKGKGTVGARRVGRVIPPIPTCKIRVIPAADRSVKIAKRGGHRDALKVLGENGGGMQSRGKGHSGQPHEGKFEWIKFRSFHRLSLN